MTESKTSETSNPEMSPEHRSNFAHAMLREIYEQPEAIERALSRYTKDFGLREKIFGPVRAWFRQHPSVVIAASGSSRHAGLAAEIMLEDMSGLAVEVEYASEYTFRPDRALKDAGVIVVSQSGETADTLAALREVIRRCQGTMAVTNVAASSMMRESDIALTTEAGQELAIPATKSFTTQLVVLYLLALAAAEVRSALSRDEIAERLEALTQIPALLTKQLPGWERQIAALSGKYSNATTFLYLGRGVHYPIAREGALKLKESSYVHAEGYPSGELLHGPNALVSDSVPLIVIATVDHADAESLQRYEKTLQLLATVKKQGARVLAIVNASDTKVPELADDYVSVEPTLEHLLPIPEVVPLQLFAYFIALEKDVDVDRPRNLVKAVVVE